jgi:hypothetical protein
MKIWENAVNITQAVRGGGMKVRHYTRSDLPILHVIEETPNYYIVEAHRPDHEIYADVVDKLNYRPVPEPRWEDVTEECATNSSNELLHAYPDGHTTYVKVVTDRDNAGRYRLRKVTFPSTYRDKHKCYSPNTDTEAFIIERQVIK